MLNNGLPPIHPVEILTETLNELDISLAQEPPPKLGDSPLRKHRPLFDRRACADGLNKDPLAKGSDPSQ